MAVAGYIASGIDTSAGKSKEVIEKSETEPVLEQGVMNATQYADRLGERWRDREKREGTIKWFCPFEAPGSSRQLFDTKKACQTYISKNFKMRVKQAKLEKKPKETYTPQQAVISPKRTLADFVLPEHADKVMAAQRAAMEVQGLGQIARRIGARELTAGVLVRMMESDSVAKVKELGDDELKRTVFQAGNHSKRKLLRAAQAEMTRRGL